MQSTAKKFSPAMFVLALLCFFLPFANVSCGGEKVFSLTGIQMITGTTIKQAEMFGPDEVKKVSGEPLAVLAFLSGLVGLGLSFLKGSRSAIAPAILAGIGAIGLLLLKSKLDNEVLKESGGLLRVDYDIGFWLTLLSYVAAAVLNGISFAQRRSMPVQHHVGPTPQQEQL